MHCRYTYCMFISSPSKSALYGGVTDKLRRKAILDRKNRREESSTKGLTGKGENFYSMTHHRHFMERGLSIEENVTGNAIRKESYTYIRRVDLLAIFEMPFNDPSVLKKCVGSFIVPKIYTFSCVANHVASTRIRSRTIPNEVL